MPSCEQFLVNYYDDGVAYICCAAGHKTAFLVQSFKFETLLESGAIAFLEGFTLEACASFSAALERFYEFALQMISAARGISGELFEKLFDEMARQSERQLGAFIAFYALEFGKPYKPDKSISEFRNSVIHKGKIPTMEEAENFLAKIYRIIVHLYKLLAERYPDHLNSITFRELRKKRETVPPEVKIATSFTTGFFKSASFDTEPDFQEAIENFKLGRKRLNSHYDRFPPKRQ